MTDEKVLANGLANRLRHLAVEFRDSRRSELATNATESLFWRLRDTLVTAIHGKLLPESIMVEIYDSKKLFEPSLSNFFWELALPNALLGYSSSDFDIHTNPEEHDDETMSYWGGERVLIIKPGFIAKEWPQVFDPIFRCLNYSDDPELVAIQLAGEKRFEIVGYHAKACELLAEWIETTLAKTQSKPDELPKEFPADGLNEIERTFTWGGQTYKDLKSPMMQVLAILEAAYPSGRSVSLKEMRHKTGDDFTEGFYKVFNIKVKSKNVPHEVKEIVQGNAAYRLAAPGSIKGPK